MLAKYLMRRFSSKKFNHLPYRFEFEDSAKWKSYLDQHGFVVVNSISESEASEAFQNLLDTLCYLSDGKLKRSDHTSFQDSNNYPVMWKQSIVQYVAHTKWQWGLREKCSRIFAKLWDKEIHQMATSFDGFCYFGDSIKYNNRDPLSWLHTDQSPSKKFKWCIQGVLNLLPCHEKDGGLIVIPNSHLKHAEFFSNVGKANLTHNFYMLDENEKSLPIFQNHIKVCAEKGDLILFDSRTFHCNVPPDFGHSRSCAYICQVPCSQVNDYTQKQRKIAIQDHRTSTHHPGDDFEVFPLIPYGADEKLIPKIEKLSIKLDELTPVQRSLACYTDFSEPYVYKKVGEEVSEADNSKILIRYRQF